MFRHKKYRKKIRITYIASAMAISFGMIIAFPWIPAHSAVDTKDGYYVVELNGKKIGSAKNATEVQDALNKARTKLNKENGGITYVEQDVSVKEQHRITGTTMDEKSMTDAMYKVLKNEKKQSEDEKEQAYVVKIDDYSVTLATEEEVIELLNSVKSKYDTDNQFQIGLKNVENNAYSYMTWETSRAEKAAKETSIVASADGDSGNADLAGETADEQQNVSKDGVKDISFVQDIQVMETYVDKSQVMDLQSAVDDVTKDKAESEIYTVSEGDCLSTIAEKYHLYMAEILAMNPGLTADSLIGIGDQIKVTVPKPELSVVVTEQKTYQETYNADVQYVYNDSKYTTEENVISEGNQGIRNVIADVTYEDGAEKSRNIISETVVQEASPKVIEKGTIVPPSYIKPLAGGVFTSGFGARWGTTHKGVDWACPVGTAINASCGGRVVIAGWVRGYGYCVEIAHSDGNHTRYGHLSRILVSVGDVVSQGDRVALSGNTGDSTGPHVHFEIIVGGSQVNPLDII